MSLSIRQAMIAIVASIMAALGGVGLLAIWQLNSLQESVVALGNEWLPSVEATLHLATDHEAMRRLASAHVAEPSDAGMTQLEAGMKDASQTLDASIATYEALVRTPEERTNFDALAASRTAYVALREKLVVLSRTGRKDEAQALLSGEMREVAGKLGEQMATAAKINETGAADEVARAKSAYGVAVIVVSVAMGIGLLLGFAAIAFTVRGVLRPIDAMTGAMGTLATGDTAVEIPGVGRTDEIGHMADAVQVFRENMIAAERLRAEQAEAETRAAATRRAEMIDLADRFQRAVGGIVETVSTASGQLESAAVALTKTADTTQHLSTMVATASEQTSANVSGVAAASEQLAATVSEIGRQVQQSSTIAHEAVTQASRTNDRVSELSQSAERIGDVIGLINTIAGQTNLLALNATIEAARAGDAGKGFAVVAQEVKALAAQTGKATSEIAAQIAGMQTATGEAVMAIKEITETINRMSEISGAIAAAVAQQGATTTEISRNVMEAAKGTSDVATNITDVSKGATDTGTASGEVLASARRLTTESASLRREVESFLATVRAA